MDSTSAFFQSSGTSPSLHDFSEIMENGLAMVSDSSFNTLSRYCQGPFICRAQASVTVQTPVLPSLTVGLCSHQPGFLFPRPGAQQCWKVRGEESVENLGLFHTGLSIAWRCFNPLEVLSAAPQESLLWNSSVTPSTPQPREVPCPPSVPSSDLWIFCSQTIKTSLSPASS